jgi:phosphoribosylamine---glycine ligase
MRILVMDELNLSLDWSLRCIEDGHQVKWYGSSDPQVSEVGKGMIEKVDNPHDWYRWADLIMFTGNSKWLDLAESWKKQGWPVIVGSKESCEWELDRKKGQDVLKQASIDIIPTREFTEYRAAIKHIEKTMKRYVCKPNNSGDKALSYCSKTPEDMIYMLERWEKKDKLKGSFILQEFIDGCEMAVSGWYGPGGFNIGWEENWEFKKFMNDDIGVATGEQGTVMRFVKKSKLADLVLAPLEPQLKKAGFIGNIDVNCIIDKEGKPWPIEFTMRPGWPAFNIQQALHKGDHAEWLMDLWEGKDARNWELDTVAVGVVMSIPNYPFTKTNKKEDVEGIPIYGDLKRPSISLCECQMGEAPMNVLGRIVTRPIVTTAGDYVLVSTGTGATITEAKKEAYSVLKSLSIPNSPMYRTDIGNRLKKQLPDLQRHGYAMGLQF